jgi:hypothetical protein
MSDEKAEAKPAAEEEDDDEDEEDLEKLQAEIARMEVCTPTLLIIYVNQYLLCSSMFLFQNASVLRSRIDHTHIVSLITS